MGLGVDLDNCSISFDRSLAKAVIDPGLSVLNKFPCVLPAFEIEYTFRFEKQSRAPTARSPAFPDLWEVGIVQNVVWEQLRLKYADGRTFEVEFAKPALDSVATTRKPFIHDPVAFLKGEFGKLRKDKSAMTPVRKVWVTARAMGEDLIRPTDPNGIREQASLSVDYTDKPSFAPKFALERGITLVHAERIVTLRNWLLARKDSETKILAHVELFSLVFSMKREPAPDEIPTSPSPPTSTIAYVQAGGARKVISSGVPSTPSISVGSGDGGHTPVLDGETAVKKAREWFIANKLAPE